MRASPRSIPKLSSTVSFGPTTWVNAALIGVSVQVALLAVKTRRVTGTAAVTASWSVGAAAESTGAIVTVLATELRLNRLTVMVAPVRP